jgi:hypothetical protein
MIAAAAVNSQFADAETEKWSFWITGIFVIDSQLART